MISRRSFFGTFVGICAAPFACKVKLVGGWDPGANKQSPKIFAVINGKIRMFSWDQNLHRRYLDGEWKSWKAIDDAYDRPFTV